jgi:predicted metal-dependent phosphoesterase TrpH
LARCCQELFKLIFALHKERIKYEKGGSVQNAPIKIFLYHNPSDPMPNEEELEFIYPSRGETLDKLRSEGNKIYSELINEGFERKNPGKIVAIDIDEKKVIELDYTLAKIVQSIYERNSTGRIFIRRVGKDEKITVEIY